MSVVEKQVVSLLSQLNRTALLRVMENIVNRLKKEDEVLYDLTEAQWAKMDVTIQNYENGQSSVINREALESKVKSARK
ncbi:MAG: hypothetical protein SF052_05345 [Bacteroidia bacterium]|nr:hypothetical protein [Bacteroidia bacterium]